MLYKHIVRPLLYLLNPELAHRIAVSLLRIALAFAPLRALARALLMPRVSSLRVRALGLDFPTPIGLAAGFDKNAIAFEALGATGFGFVEVGTLTGQPQPGNPRPRLFRLPADRALINRMGFNNRGSADAARRLSRPRNTLVGINLGKSKVVPESEAAADYVLSAERLGAYADYIVVNVSSPNTPGLRDLQSVEKLRPLLQAVRRALPQQTPLLVKIAPDLSNEGVEAVADLALELGLDGIIATNTTIARTGLHTGEQTIEAIGAGGLSGPMLAERALEVLRILRAKVADRIVLIAAGGIGDAEEAYRRIRAGATLLQVYTAYIYEGPLLPRRIALGLAALLERDGFASVQDAVGVDAAPSR